MPETVERMNGYLFTTILFLCIALIAGALIKIFRLRKLMEEDYLTSFLYFFLFISIYGFYGVWGPAFAEYVILPATTIENTGIVSNFLMLLGLPFLAASWFMLLKVASDLAGKRYRISSLIVTAMAGACIWIAAWLLAKPAASGQVLFEPMRLVMAGIHSLFFFISGIALLMVSQEKTPWRESRPLFWLGFALILSGLVQSAGIYFHGWSNWVDAAACLGFFGSLFFPLLILALSPPLKKELTGETRGFKAFCLKYGITPREAEIAQEICLGKANKEIASRLFITEQTVKDHASSIYIKTDVKSRVQLVNLIGVFESIQPGN